MGTLIILGLLLALILVGGWWFFFYETRGGLREKALGLAAMGKAMDAKALVRDQLDLAPDDPQILHLMSKIYGMEGDLLNEAAYLEKVVQIGKYDRELTATLVTARLANIYYQKDMYEEAFFYYLDALDHDPRNMEALVRLAFLCIGQREFELAEKFMRQVPDDQVKFSSYFIGRGVVATMLDRMSEVDYFQKAYEMDPDSTVAAFLYAMSLFKQRKFQEALDIANSLVDLMHDDGIRYTLFQFIMVLNLCQSDYIASMINAKLCIEIARRNEWKEENAESNFYYAAICMANNDLEQASEYLIEAEYEKPNDIEIIGLANYKFDLEEGNATAGVTSARGFNFKTFLAEIPEKVFPADRFFELSGLKMPVAVNIRGIVNSEGTKIISKLNMMAPDRISRYLALKGNSYKNACSRIISEMGYRAKKELPALESEGLNYLAVNKQDEVASAVFRFRKWKHQSVSDVFLNEFMNSIAEQGAQKGFLVGDCELTIGAKRLMRQHEGRIVIIQGREFDILLEKVFK